MARPGHRITKRELEVLRLIATGCSHAAIATRLGLSINTIGAHAKKLFAKLGVHTAAHAVMRGVELQLLAIRSDGTKK